MKPTKIDLTQFKEMFPLLGRFTERFIRRVQILRSLQETLKEEDEAEQLRKIEAKKTLSALVKLEDWK